MSQISMSSHWTSWSGTDQQWNTAVNQFPFSNIYQSAQWAQYKSVAGWDNLRLVRLDPDQNLVAVDTTTQQHNLDLYRAIRARNLHKMLPIPVFLK